MGEPDSLMVVAIGEEWCGKSTLCAHLIHQCGGITNVKLEELKDTAQQMGKDGSSFAFFFSTSKSERERAITSEVRTRYLTTPNRLIGFVDTPGHRAYLKQVVHGVGIAEIALFVITMDDCRKDLSKRSITYERAIILKAYGIKQIIVCINKMDSKPMEYNQEAFDSFKQRIVKMLLRMSFISSNITVIPTSAWYGENLTTLSDRMPWYTGPTVLQALECIQKPETESEVLRLSVYHSKYKNGVGRIFYTRIHSGILRNGMELIFAPNFTNESFTIQSIEINNQYTEKAGPGDCVGLLLTNANSLGKRLVGLVAGCTIEPPIIIKTFIAQIMIINHPGILLEGYTPVLDCHTAHVPCKWIKFIDKINTKTKTRENEAKFLRQGDCAVIEMMPLIPVYVESHSSSRLSRIVIRDLGKVVAIGVIKSTKSLTLTKAAR